MSGGRKRRAHDPRLLKWPFTVTFCWYSLLSLLAGTSEAGEQGFLQMLLLQLLLDACLYAAYCLIVSPERDDIRKLWTVFLIFYSMLTVPLAVRLLQGLLS